MRTRRVAVAGLVAVALIAIGGGLVLRAPALVRARLVEAAGARGLAADVGAVSIGLRGVELGELRLHAVAGDVFEFQARSLRVEVNPLVLVMQGMKGITGIRMGKLEVKLRAVPVLHGVLAGLGGPRNAPATESPARRPHPPVAIDAFSVEVLDAQGTLITASGSLAVTGDQTRLVWKEVRAGAAPEAAIELSSVRIEASRVSGAMQWTGAVVGGATVRLPAPRADDAGDAGAVPTHERLRAAWDAMRGQGHPTGPAPGGGTTAHASAEARRPGGRLAPEAVFTLAGARVLAADGAKVIDGLKAEVTAGREGSLRLSGSGKARGEGSLRWNLHLWLEELRAEGDVELRGVPLAVIAPLLLGAPWHEPELTRVDAELHVKSESLDRIAFDGDVELHGAALVSPRIAPEPVRGLDLAVRGAGKWFPLSRRLELVEGTVALGKVVAGLVGEVEMPSGRYLVDLTAQLPPTPCNDAVLAIPAALLGDMRHARWEGKIGGSVHVRVDSRDFAATALAFEVEDRCEFTEVPLMADLRRFHEPFVHSVLEDDDTLFEMETGPGTANWARLEDISPFFVHAVLAHEDTQFFTHHGFSPSHIRAALARDLEAGRYVVGASTITMQLVKNVFLRREKTLARKIQEVLLTWWVERVMPKRDILELYLNVIEYGPGVYGIRNGARHYFNRLPAELSPAESVYLSTILPGPKRYHAHFERGALPPGWKDRMRAIFDRMRQRGWYSPEAVDYGLAEMARFRFVPEGTTTQARVVPGSAAPLPYDGDEALLDGWDDAEGEVDTEAAMESLTGLEDGTERTAGPGTVGTGQGTAQPGTGPAQPGTGPGQGTAQPGTAKTQPGTAKTTAE